jgi:hypothetical protein
MGRKEQLEKEIDFLKEKYKNYFLILFAVLSGEATMIYAVMSGDKPLYVLFLAIVGLLAFTMLAYRIKNIESTLYEKLDELGEV